MSKRKALPGVYRASKVVLEALVPTGCVGTHRHSHDSIAIEAVAVDAHGLPLVTRQFVTTPMRKLWEAGAIGEGEVEAAKMLRGDHDAAFAGMAVKYEMAVDGGRNGSRAMDARVFHSSRLRRAMAFLGGELARVAWAGIIERPMADIAGTFQALGMDFLPGETKPVLTGGGKALLVVTCRELAVFYGMRMARRDFIV